MGDRWQLRAACRGMAPNDGATEKHPFFPGTGAPTAHLKKVCEWCPVRSECLEDALADTERFGIWGGLSERERRQLRASRERTRRRAV